MPVGLSKSLNPDAEEWRPTPQQPPLRPPQILPHLASPQQPVQAVIATSPPHKLSFQLPPQHIYFYVNPLPYKTTVSCPPHGCFYKAVTVGKSVPGVEAKGAKGFDGGDEMNIPQHGDMKRCKEKSESRKSPPVDVVDKGKIKVLPPQLRRVERSFGVARKPPPKQEFRPRKSVHSCCKVPSDGGVASHSPSSPILAFPQQPSADDFSHSNTTVMIKNIPNRLRRDFMLKFLDDYCKSYSLEYDFLYLPMDFRKEGNLGYAFVNFTSAAAAMQFKNILENYKWQVVDTAKGPITSKKICEVTWARIQGKEALIKRFENSSFHCENVDFLPVVLDPPRNGSDPDPSPPVILGKLHRRRAVSKIY